MLQMLPAPTQSVVPINLGKRGRSPFVLASLFLAGAAPVDARQIQVAFVKKGCVPFHLASILTMAAFHSATFFLVS